MLLIPDPKGLFSNVKKKKWTTICTCPLARRAMPLANASGRVEFYTPDPQLNRHGGHHDPHIFHPRENPDDV